MNRIAMALVVGALALAPGVVLASADGHSLEQVVVEMATTPAQHAALAKHYRAKAEEARAEMSRHERMARSYGLNQKLTQRNRMKSHCEKLAKENGEIAKEFDALAKLHDDEAKPAKSDKPAK